MPALRSIRPAVGGVARNPVLVAVSALFALAQFPDLIVRPTASPGLAAAVSALTFGVLILVVPFFQGGLLAMADEALDGRTGVAGFVRIPAEDVTLVAVLGIIVVGLFGAYLLVTFFIQFYAHAVVVEDAELVAAFRRSVRLVRSNLGAAIPYTVILAAVGAPFGLLVAAAALTLAPPPAMDTPRRGCRASNSARWGPSASASAWSRSPASSARCGRPTPWRSTGPSRSGRPRRGVRRNPSPPVSRV